MNVLDIIHEASETGRARFSFETLPPLKGDGTRTIFATVEALREFDPAFINVTFQRESIKQTVTPQGAIEWHLMRRRPGTVGISAAIRSHFGIETVPHLICGGFTKYDTEDALIDMDFLGLHNVLALRGDAGPNERHFMPLPGGHSHAVDLVRQIAAMNRGEFLDGEVEHCSHSKFSIGVAGYPEKHSDAVDAATDLHYLKEKVDAGADYIMTQICFDADIILDFRKKCREVGINVPILAGIKPFATARQLTLLPQIFSIVIPEPLRKEVEAHISNSEAIRQIGVEWAVDQCKRLIKAGIPDIHFYTMGKAENIRQIVKRVF